MKGSGSIGTFKPIGGRSERSSVDYQQSTGSHARATEAVPPSALDLPVLKMEWGSEYRYHSWGYIWVVPQIMAPFGYRLYYGA